MAERAFAYLLLLVTGNGIVYQFKCALYILCSQTSKPVCLVSYRVS